ncbi:LacI family transcriptional regulator [Nakamurella flava]|uniref:LacI family transcriptional regulator n=1 Tax=Nakamurella flava TaxID=2576308 RepID=A0A4U6QN16_9ACTN|nr:LacI family DNA-binding transcriptional regulator [Nakamurella flava]TKV61789.1 LacI family transcriptional regulator [Nakamurella flava]
MTVPPAGRRPTLADVAAAAGVSVALVSIVMRDAPGAGAATRERVRRVADEIGYRPDAGARRLRSARSRLLGVVFEVEQPFHADLVGGLYQAAERRGYDLTLSAVTGRRSEERAVDDLLRDRCEGLVLLGSRATTARLADLGAQIPLVSVARAVRSAEVDVVRTADAEGLRDAVDHLVALGHRRIAHADGGRAAGAADRRRGYAEAMAAHGLTDHLVLLPGGLGAQDGEEAGRALLALRPRPTAVAVFNDRCAFGLLDALRRAGVDVPGEISVVGFDDSSLARLSAVDLSSVAQDTDRLADLAVDRLADRLDGDPDGARPGPREQVVAPRLVVRSSTAPPFPGPAG